MDDEVALGRTKKEIYLGYSLYDSLEDNNLRDTRILIEDKRADPNISLPEHGVSPFHFAVGNEVESFAEDVTVMFLLNGGNPNVRSVEGITPVHIAAAWGRQKILHLLLVNGGDPWLKDEDGKSALDFAAEEKHWHIVEELKKFRNIDATDDDKSGPKYSIFLEKIVIHEGEYSEEYLVVDETKCTTPLQSPKRSMLRSQKSPRVMERKTEPVCVPSSSVDKLLPQAQNKECDVSKGCVLKISDNSLRIENVRDLTMYMGKFSVKERIKKWCDELNNRLKIPGIERKKNKAAPEDEEVSCCGDADKAFFTDDCDLCEDKTVPVGGEGELPLPKEPVWVTEVALENKSLSADGETELPLPKEPTEGTEAAFEKDCSCKYKNEVDIVGSETLPSKNKAHLVIEAQKTDVEKGESDVAVVSDTDLPPSVMSTPKLSGVDKPRSSDVSKPLFVNVGDKPDLASCQSSDASTAEAGAVEYVVRQSPVVLSSAVSASSDYHSALSISEEYRYTDEEEGVVLIEKRYPTNVTSSPGVLNDIERKCFGRRDSDRTCIFYSTDDSSVSDISSVDLNYDTDTLRTELVKWGINPGPIINTTKMVYLKKLARLKKKLPAPPQTLSKGIYCDELQRTLKDVHSMNFDKCMNLEKQMAFQFQYPDPVRRWREGVIKSSFNYLLLDPRITNNLPWRATCVSKAERWSTFLSSIFYIGKGKRSRPYAHLYDAVTSYNKGSPGRNRKTKYIKDIWEDKLGVVCLHVYQNVIPVEAYTREAAMIEAIGLNNLTNSRSGEYYGVAATWSGKMKRKLGIYLLYKAMLIFLSEGERQLHPADIGL